MEYRTWASRGEEPFTGGPSIPVEALPPPEARPWAGIVSHHLLAHRLIDRWFAELAARRTVRTFFVLSPSHWGLSSQEWSLTDGAWLVGEGGRVESDRRVARSLTRRLGVEPEPGVFRDEHGVSTLAPYIARHFPGARIVALAYRGEPPLDQPKAERLCQALAPCFDAEGRARDFLLISADFAHHGDAEGTRIKDERSRRFLDAPSFSTWIFAGCDNRPGIYCLARLLGDDAHSAVLFHSDSFELSGRDGQDITSYFFAFFWEG